MNLADVIHQVLLVLERFKIGALGTELDFAAVTGSFSLRTNFRDGKPTVFCWADDPAFVSTLVSVVCLLKVRN